jgi:hypothetical protein
MNRTRRFELLCLAFPLLLTACPVTPIVRVSRDVGGGANRNLDIHAYYSDMTNDNFDNNGGQMGGTISAVANFSDQFVMFGTRPDGVFGHGESVCIAPQTGALNLTDVALVRTENLPAPETPIIVQIGWSLVDFPWSLFQYVPGDTAAPTFRVLHEHQNLNDQFWSYMGAVSPEDCMGNQVNSSTGQVVGGATLIERNTQGTVDIAKLGNNN